MANVYLDMAFILITLLFSFFFSYKAANGYRPSFLQVFFWIIVLIQYHHFRELEQEWDFESYSFLEDVSIFYYDFVYSALLFPLVKIFRFHIVSYAPLESADIFTEDIPISDKENDAMRRTAYAENLAGLIKHQVFKKAFTIGILGFLISLVKRVKKNSLRNSPPLSFGEQSRNLYRTFFQKNNPLNFKVTFTSITFCTFSSYGDVIEGKSVLFST